MAAMGCRAVCVCVCGLLFKRMMMRWKRPATASATDEGPCAVIAQIFTAPCIRVLKVTCHFRSESTPKQCARTNRATQINQITRARPTRVIAPNNSTLQTLTDVVVVARGGGGDGGSSLNWRVRAQKTLHINSCHF